MSMVKEKQYLHTFIVSFTQYRDLVFIYISLILSIFFNLFK